MEEEKKLSDVLEDKNNKEKFLNKKYMMHKYWGKKPAKELKKLIREYILLLDMEVLQVKLFWRTEML